jgi:hypothetical protein
MDISMTYKTMIFRILIAIWMTYRTMVFWISIAIWLTYRTAYETSNVDCYLIDLQNCEISLFDCYLNDLQNWLWDFKSPLLFEWLTEPTMRFLISVAIWMTYRTMKFQILIAISPVEMSMRFWISTVIWVTYRTEYGILNFIVIWVTDRTILTWTLENWSRFNDGGTSVPSESRPVFNSWTLGNFGFPRSVPDALCLGVDASASIHLRTGSCAQQSIYWTILGTGRKAARPRARDLVERGG